MTAPEPGRTAYEARFASRRRHFDSWDSLEPEANRRRSDAEREAVLAAAPPHILTPVALMMFAGLGPKEALSLPREAFRDGELSTSRAKTGEPVFWPAPLPLRMNLAAAPEHAAPTLCAHSEGRPWTLSGFRASWQPPETSNPPEGGLGTSSENKELDGSEGRI